MRPVGLSVHKYLRYHSLKWADPDDIPTAEEWIQEGTAPLPTTLTICMACYNSLHKAKIPKNSVANLYPIGTVYHERFPPCSPPTDPGDPRDMLRHLFSQLSSNELRMISPCNPPVNLIRQWRGDTTGQYYSVGNLYFFLNDVVYLASKLPRPPADTGVVDIVCGSQKRTIQVPLIRLLLSWLAGYGPRPAENHLYAHIALDADLLDRLQHMQENPQEANDAIHDDLHVVTLQVPADETVDERSTPQAADDPDNWPVNSTLLINPDDEDATKQGGLDAQTLHALNHRGTQAQNEVPTFALCFADAFHQMVHPLQ